MSEVAAGGLEEEGGFAGGSGRGGGVAEHHEHPPEHQMGVLEGGGHAGGNGATREQLHGVSRRKSADSDRQGGSDSVLSDCVSNPDDLREAGTANGGWRVAAVRARVAGRGEGMTGVEGAASGGSGDASVGSHASDEGPGWEEGGGAFWGEGAGEWVGLLESTQGSIVGGERRQVCPTYPPLLPFLSPLAHIPRSHAFRGVVPLFRALPYRFQTPRH